MAIFQVRKLRPEEIESLVLGPVVSVVKLKSTLFQGVSVLNVGWDCSHWDNTDTWIDPRPTDWNLKW